MSFPAPPSTPSSIELPAPQGKNREPLVAAMFDRIAPTYDCLNDVISFGMHRGWKRQAVKALQLQAGQTVLDVCTGTGDLLAYLKPAVTASGDVIGVDVSADMLGVAQQRFGNSVTLHHASALTIPLASDSVDAAIVSFGLRNVVDRERALKEFHRGLRKWLAW